LRIYVLGSRVLGRLQAVSALTSRLISLAGVKWSCLRIDKRALPPFRFRVSGLGCEDYLSRNVLRAREELLQLQRSQLSVATDRVRAKTQRLTRFQGLSPGSQEQNLALTVLFRGTSRIRNVLLIGPDSRPMLRALRCSWGGGGQFLTSEVTLYGVPRCMTARNIQCCMCHIRSTADLDAGDAERAARDLIQTSVHDTHSGSMKFTTSLDRISRCKTASGANSSDR